MREKRLRKLFLRYREQGDVDALTAVFDATAPGLLGLARQLMGRGGEAEDALQATFLTAIERRATYDAGYPLQPWLTGILVRKARRVAEQAQRRPEPERVGLPAASDPVEDASQAELSTELQSALSDLPERYRSVLQPFLQHGDRPQEIARRRGIAPGTVRVQIHRGLEMLRKALPASYAGGAGAVVPLPPGALDAIRAAVGQAAREAVPAAGKVGAGGALGGLAPRVAAGVLGLALAGAGAWQLWRPERPIEVPGPVAHGAEPAGLATPDEDEERGPDAQLADPTAASGVAGAEGRESLDAEPEPRVQAWSLHVVVTGVGPKPPEDLVLNHHPTPPPTGGTFTSQSLPLVADGRVTVPLDGEALSGEEAPRWTLSVSHGAYAPIKVHTGPDHVTEPFTLEVTLELERTKAILFGRVAACADASPWVGFFPRGPLDEDRHVTLGQTVHGRCDESGGFRLYVEPDADGWFAAVADGCAPEGHPLTLEGFESRDLGTVELGAGASIEGSAVAPEGADPSALRGDVVAQRVAPEGTPRSGLWSTQLFLLPDRVERAYMDVPTDAEGAFRMVGLAEGEHDVIFVARMKTSGYYDAHAHGTRVRAPAKGLLLEDPVRVYTLQVVSGGKAVADATVHYDLGGGSSVSAPTEPDGSYPFSMAWNDEAHPVTIRKLGFETRELQLAPRDFGADRRLEVELTRSQPASDLTLELVPAGGPLGHLVVELNPLGVDSDWRLYRRIDGGETRIELGEVPAGRHRLRLVAGLDRESPPEDQGLWRTTQLEVDLRAGVAEELRVPLEPGGRIAFDVIGLTADAPCNLYLANENGERVVRLIEWDPDRGTLNETNAVQLTEDRTYWPSSVLAPGEYELRAQRGTDQREFSFAIAEGTSQHLPVDLR